LFGKRHYRWSFIFCNTQLPIAAPEIWPATIAAR
jgi:hypothetical protein